MIVDSVHQAARAIADASAVIVAAGAGMGVDSGLPDFRGNDGFWNAYPPYRRLGVSFSEMANPVAFRENPAFGWGFYGHRLNLYRAAVPHEGFAILRRWGDAKPGGCFVYTSNVDGQFQKAGFPHDRVFECHGSIHHLQCFDGCCDEIWPADQVAVQVDPDTMLAVNTLPRCGACGTFARPNILMFGDMGWLEARADEQHASYRKWLRQFAPDEVVVVELGAGSAIPAVRSNSERLQSEGATLIRINPREPGGPRGTLSFTTGALASLTSINDVLHGTKDTQSPAPNASDPTA